MLRGQINRAFSGRTKFSIGPLVSTLGKPCGNCPLCRRDLVEAPEQREEEGHGYCEITKVRSIPAGFFLVGENSMRQLTSFTFNAHTEVTEMKEIDGEYVELQRNSLIGDLKDDTGKVTPNFEIEEKAWTGRRDLLAAVSGRGTSSVHCSDGECQKLLRAVLNLSGNEMRRITKLDVCGIILERSGKSTIPHYVEAAGSYTQMDSESRFFYSGEKSSSPALFEEDYPYPDDNELESVIRDMLKCNAPHVVAMAVGWTAACHFREHIQQETNQFPLMNLNGGAGAGKSSFAFLCLILGGMDYSAVDFINVETSSIYPLVRYVTSSTTVPRMIEEVNPSNIDRRKYGQILGILKAGWNRAPVPRGYVSGKAGVKITSDRVSSPIVFISEQPSTVPSLRSRSVEVRLESKSLSNSEYVKAYKKAFRNRTCLTRMAKALVTKSLNTSPKTVMDLYDQVEDLIPDEFGQRPKFGYQTCLVGLELLAQTCEAYEVDVYTEVRELAEGLVSHLSNVVSEVSKDKNITEVDKVLLSFDAMASEPEDLSSGLRPGDHYWRQGDSLYLCLTAIMPRYLRFARSTGEIAAIRDASTMGSLMNGETYFLRSEPHPLNSAVKVHVIDIAGLTEKGTVLSHFTDGTEPNE